LTDNYRLLKVRTEIFPSEEAQARIAPSSCGAQETEFTVEKHVRFQKSHPNASPLTRSGVESVLFDLGPTAR